MAEKRYSEKTVEALQSQLPGPDEPRIAYDDYIQRLVDTGVVANKRDYQYLMDGLKRVGGFEIPIDTQKIGNERWVRKLPEPQSTDQGHQKVTTGLNTGTISFMGSDMQSPQAYVTMTEYMIAIRPALVSIGKTHEKALIDAEEETNGVKVVTALERARLNWENYQKSRVLQPEVSAQVSSSYRQSARHDKTNVPGFKPGEDLIYVGDKFRGTADDELAS